MKDLTLKDAIIQLWLIRHGDTETASLWVRQLGRKLIEQESLNSVESTFLASALLGCADTGTAERLFNNGKPVHKSNRFSGDFKLYQRVQAYREEGKTLKQSLNLAGDDLNYSDEFNDEWVTTAQSRYERVVKSLNELFDEIQERTALNDAWQDAFEEIFLTSD